MFNIKKHININKFIKPQKLKFEDTKCFTCWYSYNNIEECPYYYNTDKLYKSKHCKKYKGKNNDKIL